MAREEGRLDLVSTPMGGPASIEQPATQATGERDGAHQTLSTPQAAFVALAGLMAALGVALKPDGVVNCVG